MTQQEVSSSALTDPGKAGGSQPSDDLGCGWDTDVGSVSGGLSVTHTSLSLCNLDHPSWHLEHSPQPLLGETCERRTVTPGPVSTPPSFAA